MGRKPNTKEDPAFVEYLRDGRDEMNLLEHSISSASTKVDREVRSIVFTKEAIDPETKETVKRIWEIKFRDGRPTAVDDDVFMALLKVTADQGFEQQRIYFTRYELCRILGWSDSGRSYQMIDNALTRLRGVTIDAKNYWYDSKLKCWRNKDFDLFQLKDVLSRTTYDRALKAGGREVARSWIDWSDTMMESFANGYLRKIDLNEYLSFDNPVARKLYRFLGKQFWHKLKFSIDLPELCHEKLGYRKGTPVRELRRVLGPAIAELEERGTYGLSHEFNSSYAHCEVIFNVPITLKELAERKKGEGKRKRTDSNVESPLVERLLKFGVDRTTAADAVKRLDAERIVSDIEHVEFEAKANRIKSSKAGMLATMLKADEPWPRPEGFKSTVERELTKKKLDERKEQARLEKVAEDKRRREQDERESAEFNDFMAGLSPDAAIAFDERAKEVYWWGEKYRKALKSGDAEEVSAARHAALFSVWKKHKKGEAKSVVVQKSIHF